MKVNLSKAAIGLAVGIMLVSSLSFARPRSQQSSTSKSAPIALASSKRLVNGTVLPAGNYTLEVSGDSQSSAAAFYQHGKLVTKTPVKVQPQTGKNPATTVITDTRGNQEVVIEISPKGWTEKLLFGNEGEKTTESGQ